MRKLKWEAQYMHNNILSVLRYLPYSKEKTFLWLSQGFHLSVSLLMFWCIMQETRYRSLFCHLQLPFSRKLRPPRVFNVRQRNRLRFLKNPSTLHKFCHFEIHLKGSQLLNLVVKIPAFSLCFRDGFHLIASLFTHGITTLNSSIRGRSTGSRGISQEFSSKYYTWFFFKTKWQTLLWITSNGWKHQICILSA